MKLRDGLLQVIFTFIILGSLLIASLPEYAQASPAAQTGGAGLNVTNALLDLKATPGQVYVHKMTVSSASNTPALEVTVETRGLGQNPDGSFLPLPPDKDISPYSARTYITGISKTAFHLNPGESMPLEVTITVPQNLDQNTHYALVYVASKPINAGNGVGQIIAISVPVVITPANVQFNQTGKITDLNVAPVESGKPILISARVENTGNRHFKVKGQVRITDSADQTITDLPIPLTTNSIIPSFAQKVLASYTALDHPQGLAPGTYNATVQILMEDGTQLGSRQTQFQVTKPYRPFEGIDDAHLFIAEFNNQEPGTVDAHAKTDTVIDFENTGKVTGRLAIGKYTQEPVLSPAFSDALNAGGTGGKAIKTIAVRVDGFTQGIAHISVYYRPEELGEVVPGTLYLAYKDGNAWRKLENLDVQSGAQYVRGDIAVAQLANGPIIGLGGIALAPSTAVTTTAGPNLLTIGLGGVAILLFIAVCVLVIFGRQKKQLSNAK